MFPKPILLALLTVSAYAAPPTVRFNNTYRTVHTDRFDWTVFIDEQPSILDQIKCVEYVLHPTFSPPRRRECDRTSRFAHSTNGWGEFTIFLTIYWNNGDTSRQTYDLDLHSPYRLVKPDAKYGVGGVKPRTNDAVKYRKSITASNDAKYVGKDQWLWTVFLAGDEAAIAAIKCVEYALHPTFNPSKVVTCSAGWDPKHAFPLERQGWGSFNIGIQLQFHDRSTANLTHYLKF